MDSEKLKHLTNSYENSFILNLKRNETHYSCYQCQKKKQLSNLLEIIFDAKKNALVILTHEAGEIQEALNKTNVEFPRINSIKRFSHCPIIMKL